MPSQLPSSANAGKKRKPSLPLINRHPLSTPVDDDGEQVVSKLKEILANKAPEAIPLLNKLIEILTLTPKEIVESAKRARSVVFSGFAKANAELTPSERQVHTEEAVQKILKVLGVEARPLEVYRMGSGRFFHTALRNVRSLRDFPEFNQIYVRRSMTPQEREKFKELRQRAYDLNQNEFNGRKAYVVYRDELVKASDIPSRKSSRAVKKTCNPARFYEN
ncbi:hypothetical protein ANCDUO_01151 [Ancylostoma duodenale]|uniref:Uncharacterized protein n=1 Tax=Ancylostoma duodenale TaxID=51022 RepID=A0A0C2DEX5_9BILA|nr:hypothetical protein ANCDUO_01151 [Ancylostoma duodenale]